MFNWLKSKKKVEAETITHMVVDHVGDLLKDLQLKQDQRFNEIQAHLNELNLSIQSVDKKLHIKDIQDKQNYGQLHYKLHEVKPKIEN